MALFVLMNPFTVNRLYDAQLQTAEEADVLTVPELFGTLTDVVWSELSDSSAAGPWDNRHPRISSIRRNLQRGAAIAYGGHAEQGPSQQTKCR